jgi:hypothetical protein
MATGLEEVPVQSICPELPIVHLVVEAASVGHVVRVDASTVMATVSDHFLTAQWQLVEDTVNEPVGGVLVTCEPHLPDGLRFCRDASILLLGA